MSRHARGRRRGRRAVRRVSARLSRWDRTLLHAAAAQRTPAGDRTLTTLSRAADHGKLWLGVAALLHATGRRHDRTAAASGLVGLALASTVVNGPLKFLWRRDRPPVDVTPLLPLPRTYSFPSGHSASAFAFATGVATAMPVAAPTVLPLAGAVAYSRVHTGVHYPSDVVVGAGLGAAAGYGAARLVMKARASSVHHPDAPSLDLPVPRRAVLLGSPHAGSADDLAPAREILRDAGIEFVGEYDVRTMSDLRAAIAASSEPVLVVAAGGDGTVGLAAGAVAGTSSVLFPLPLGTSNDVARSLGIPPDAIEAAHQLAGYRVCEIDTGLVELEGRDPCTFLNAATVGLNVAFASLATKKSMRDRFGGLTYPVAAARAVRGYEPFACTVEHEGGRNRYQVVHLSVSNAPVFGGVLGMRVPGASLTDGLLDVIVVERLSVARLVLAVADTFVGNHRPVHRVHTMRVRSLRVSTEREQDIAVDGEVVGTLPADFTVRPAALRVVTPRV